jgi:hypothetical protein
MRPATDFRYPFDFDATLLEGLQAVNWIERVEPQTCRVQAGNSQKRKAQSKLVNRVINVIVPTK